MDRLRVFAAIDAEREHQDRKWGTVAEHPHEVGAWIALMEAHLDRAKTAWANANDDTYALEGLRKVLALGVACAEQHGLPARYPGPDLYHAVEQILSAGHMNTEDLARLRAAYERG